jgi:hypothetical protein
MVLLRRVVTPIFFGKGASLLPNGMSLTTEELGKNHLNLL